MHWSSWRADAIQLASFTGVDFMSATAAKRRKVTVKNILDKKARKEPIVALGVYDAPMAAISDEIGFDMLINGNAGPMSLLGH